MKAISEAGCEVIRRVAEHMETGVSVRIEIEIHEGGIRAYREIRTWSPPELVRDELKRAS